MDPAKQALDELEAYKKFQKFLKDEKGVDYTIDECYDIIQWFKTKNLYLIQHKQYYFIMVIEKLYSLWANMTRWIKYMSFTMH